MLASELVANAVRHGGRPTKPITVTVRADAEVMRVEVEDYGHGFEPDRLPGRQAGGGGWGLAIVAAVAHRWDVGRGPHTVVWFEVDRPAQGTPLTAEPSGPR